jgi:hypothetical protein
VLPHRDKQLADLDTTVDTEQVKADASSPGNDEQTEK